MDYDRISERVLAGLVQGFVVAFVGLAAFLPASYVMNRYIYHTRSMRAFMGILAALMGMGGLVILLLLRISKGDVMKVHYFGMLPFFAEQPAVTTQPKGLEYVMWFFKGAWSMFLLPMTFFYANDKADQDGFKDTVVKMLENFKTGEIHTDEKGVRLHAVSEELFAVGRDLAALTSTDYEIVGGSNPIDSNPKLQTLRDRRVGIEDTGKKLFA